MESKKYEVKVIKKEGSCDNSLFEKMAKKGDITAVKLSEVIGQVVKITGYATCEIETDDKNFTISYFDTDKFGLVSSGSDIFLDSVETYFGEVESVRLSEIKTKKGKTYKAVPILNRENNEIKEDKNEEETSDDLPF